MTTAPSPEARLAAAHEQRQDRRRSDFHALSDRQAALFAAVQHHQDTEDLDDVTVTDTAAIFLYFLDHGEAPTT